MKEKVITKWMSYIIFHINALDSCTGLKKRHKKTKILVSGKAVKRSKSKAKTKYKEELNQVVSIKIKSTKTLPRNKEPAIQFHFTSLSCLFSISNTIETFIISSTKQNEHMDT